MATTTARTPTIRKTWAVRTDRLFVFCGSIEKFRTIRAFALAGTESRRSSRRLHEPMRARMAQAGTAAAHEFVHVRDGPRSRTLPNVKGDAERVRITAYRKIVIDTAFACAYQPRLLPLDSTLTTNQGGPMHRSLIVLALALSLTVAGALLAKTPDGQTPAQENVCAK